MPWRARAFVHYQLRQRAGRPQLKRDPLGGAVTTLLEWGRQAFVASAVGFLVLAHLLPQSPQLEASAIVLACASVATLPFAAVAIWRDSDRVSRRNWIILILLCLLIIAAASVWHRPL